MQQLSLLTREDTTIRSLTHAGFSHDAVCPETARVALEQEYGYLLEESNTFNRQLVSFQGNKTERLHGWVKYREGFSAELVESLLGEFNIKSGDTVLDPFAGSCTTLLVAQALGINAVGIELLPNSHLAWDAKSRAYQYDVAELAQILHLLEIETPPASTERFPHLTITESAFPPEVERDLMAYDRWFDTLEISAEARLLCRFALMSILEDVSYTRKDGQYLRWDARAIKLQTANERRQERGSTIVAGINKGTLPSVKSEVLRVLGKIRHDVQLLQRESPPPSAQSLLRGNTLYELPKIQAEAFDAVITSPPYANRYDYTRTYALELAYLGVGDAIYKLRQDLLSCTVENRPKLAALQEHYARIGRAGAFESTLAVVSANEALAEINGALKARDRRGDINNSGVLGMVNQYFTELAFIYSELFRVCRSGARVGFVNDNVRYAGEIIPVDLLCTQLAHQIGFAPERIHVLPQRKGNSSQQMGRYGRVELRKSITVWRKP